MFKIIPIATHVIHIELPPLLINGKVCPVTGMIPNETPMFKKA